MASWRVVGNAAEAEALGPDTQAFIRALPWDDGSDDGAVVVARAPGRLDVMGGIADYSGSLVLQLPLAEGCHVALRRRGCDPKEGRMVVTSSLEEGEDRAEEVAVDLGALLRTAPEANAGAQATMITAISENEWAELKASWPSGDQWASYVVGGLLLMLREGHIRAVASRDAPCRLGDPSLAIKEEQLDLHIRSSVPRGKGVSSSAAIEVATLQALAAAFGVRSLLEDARALALLAQRVENVCVGAPCGVMDQMTSAAGRSGQLLVLTCQPATVEGFVPVPPHVRFWGIDSGVRHSVGGSDYGTVRAAAFMGRALLRKHLAACGADTRLPYLVDVAPSQLAEGLANVLPSAMRGCDFVDQCPDGHGDAVTCVDPGREYPVRPAATHPITEHARCVCFEQMLYAPRSDRQLRALGELMYQSHASYSSVGLASTATDDIVRCVRQRGTASGLYGAKITGGGSGGTVCILTDDSDTSRDAVLDIATEYGMANLGAPARVFAGSSVGASEFAGGGFVIVKLARVRV